MQTILEFDVFKNGFSNFILLDRGGQKVVYNANHPEYGDVVVKLFYKEDERSIREININNLITLDCIPIIYQTGQVIYEGTETLFIIEQKIEGEELRKKIVKGEYFNLKQAIDFLEQGLSFIKQLEEYNIVHRDIKPENIIISSQSKVFFLDFGIARILGSSSLTDTAAIAGPHSAGYSAPEQFNNLKKDIDSRADLFSMGVVTYECITGKNPFSDGATSHLDILQRTETITPVIFKIPGDTQQQFMGLLSSLMGKFPSRRPKDATQALNWLNAAKATFLIKGE